MSVNVTELLNRCNAFHSALVRITAERDALTREVQALQTKLDSQGSSLDWHRMMLQSLAVELLEPEQMAGYEAQPALLIQAAKNVNANEAFYRGRSEQLTADLAASREAQATADGELRAIDALIARRPALDERTRYANIAKAIRVAGEATTALATQSWDLGRAREAQARAERERDDYRATAAQYVSLARDAVKLRDRAERAEQQAEEARARCARLETALGREAPWDATSVLRRLADAAGHLLGTHCCDDHGWEEIEIAKDRARRIADDLEAAIASASPAKRS